MTIAGSPVLKSRNAPTIGSRCAPTGDGSSSSSPTRRSRANSSRSEATTPAPRRQRSRSARRRVADDELQTPSARAGLHGANCDVAHRCRHDARPRRARRPRRREWRKSPTQRGRRAPRRRPSALTYRSAVNVVSSHSSKLARKLVIISPTPFTVATATASAAVATPVRLNDALTPRTASVTAIPARRSEQAVERAHQRMVASGVSSAPAASTPNRPAKAA